MITTRTAEEILRAARLPSPPPSGKWRYYATCPECSAARKTKAHRDAKVLAITISDVGVRWFCNHCPFTGGDYFQSNGKGHDEDFAAVHDYHGGDGTLLAQKVRNPAGREPKCWWRRPDGNGGWIKGTKGIDTSALLYRVHAALDAHDNGAEIAIVEGEKDVDRLWKLGIAATCNAHGAAATRDANGNPVQQSPKWHEVHSEQLRGVKVIVFNDNDEQGYAHAEATANSLLGIAARVRRLDLKEHWLDMPEGADVSDWLDAFHTREDLEALIAAAPEWKGEPQPSPSDIITQQSVMLDFVAKYQDDLRFNHDSKRWLTWRTHHWKPDHVERAFCWALEFCRTRTLPNGHPLKKSQRNMLETIHFARAVEDGARAQVEFATSSEDWDQDPWLLGTPDGVIDLRTGELRPGKPTDMISKITTVTPAEDEICPQWIEFVNFALDADVDNIDFLKRCCGYALTGLTSEERLLFVIGLSGTGKGTFTKTFVALMGDYATNMPVTMFTDQSSKQEYYRAKLHGYRLVLASEPDKDSVWSEAFVNEVTGSDRLNGRHPGGRPFTFNPTHKLWVHGNTAPDLKGFATGLKRRLDMLPFDQVPAEPDTRLKDKLTKEGPGILRWAINGCLDWQKTGLAPPPDVQAAAAEYFERQDTFRRWVEDYCNVISAGRETPGALRQSFNTWAGRNGEKPMTANAFHDAIRFSPCKLDQRVIGGKKWVLGIALKPTDQNEFPI